MEKAKPTPKGIRADIQELKSDADRLVQRALLLRLRCADLEDRVSDETPKTAKSDAITVRK